MRQPHPIPPKNLSQAWLTALNGVLIVLIVGVAWLHFQRDQLADDAYITYRYARHVADDNALLYNLNEPVLGTTAPGYALILGFTAKLVPIDIPTLSRWLNMAFFLGTAVCVGWIARILTHQLTLGILVGLLVVVSPYSASATMLGMETPLFLAGLSGALLLHVKGYWRMSAVLSGSMVWLRPEGFFIVGLFGLAFVWLWRQKRVSFRQFFVIGLCLSLPVMLEIGFNVLSYGSFVPQSVQAKAAGLYPLTIVQTLTIMLRYTGRYIPIFDSLPLYFGVLLLNAGLCLGLSVLAFRWLVRQHLILGVVPILYGVMVFFYGFSSTLIFEWYYGNFELLEETTLLIGVSVAIGIFLRWRRRTPSAFLKGLLLYIAILVLALPQSGLLWAPRTSEYPYVSGREGYYYALAQAIRPAIPLRTTLAMPEIGVLGYFLDNTQVLDTAGLVTPSAIKYFPVPLNERASEFFGVIPRQFIQDEQPDLLITVKSFGELGVLVDPWFLAHYTAVVVWQDDWLLQHGGALVVYSRNDFGAGMALLAQPITLPRDTPLSQ